ncbi:sodium:calcium antiporter [Methylophilus sp.]|uniref:sodium:calcium antiporter n=1 Tax=Methylophilus sp. TaxID=29541 RepID=UPI000D4CDAE4|nr:sodium:calcium antiporter [Methylophilus sp.]PPD12606.1 MAG: conjugal transfer protein TraR [Methylophilus sp.]
MLTDVLIFILSLSLLLFSARVFTQNASEIGKYLRLPEFVIGIFIVGIGTSLPELISGILSVKAGVSSIVPGNIMGASISNLLLVTGLAVVIHRKPIQLGSAYIFIDLHFLVGSFFAFTVIAYDGVITWPEAIFGMMIFLIYSIYLVKGGQLEDVMPDAEAKVYAPPAKAILYLILASVGIYFGADYTVSAIASIAKSLSIPESVIALTVLSIGTTLPELAVNISAVSSGKAEMAIGNVLGSCVFNSLVIPFVVSLYGTISVPQILIYFSLPFMLAAGLLFYLLTQDKKVSVWEGLLMIWLYSLFIFKVATQV